MAERETVVLDGEKMISRREAHDHLTERLGLPEYYGRNLDGLYDLLTERQGPTRIVIRQGDTLLSWLGDYGKALIQTLLDADRANPGLEVLLSEEYGGAHPCLVRAAFCSEVEQFLKFFVQGDAQHQGQLGGGVELPGFNGADGIAGHAYQLRQGGLGEAPLRPGVLEAVLQNQLVVHHAAPIKNRQR